MCHRSVKRRRVYFVCILGLHGEEKASQCCQENSSKGWCQRSSKSQTRQSARSQSKFRCFLELNWTFSIVFVWIVCLHFFVFSIERIYRRKLKMYFFLQLFFLLASFYSRALKSERSVFGAQKTILFGFRTIWNLNEIVKFKKLVHFIKKLWPPLFTSN